MPNSIYKYLYAQLLEFKNKISCSERPPGFSIGVSPQRRWPARLGRGAARATSSPPNPPLTWPCSTAGLKPPPRPVVPGRRLQQHQETPPTPPHSFGQSPAQESPPERGSHRKAVSQFGFAWGRVVRLVSLILKFRELTHENNLKSSEKQD